MSIATDTLITEVDGGPALVASRCGGCATLTFPVAPSCPRCGQLAPEPTALPSAGTLWTWTVQRFAPKPPYRGSSPFAAFAVGYVDLGEVRVEAQLSGKAPDAWRIGDAVRLAVRRGDQGDGAGTPGPAFWFEAV